MSTIQAENLASTAAAAKPRLADYQAADFVIWTMLVALALFACAALPRAFARLSFPQTAKQGWSLKHAPPPVRDPIQRVRTVNRGQLAAPWEGGDNDEKVLAPPRAAFMQKNPNGRRSMNVRLNRLTRHWAEKFDVSQPRVAPLHVPSLRTLLYPLSSQFSRRIMGFSLGQAFILLAYTTLICFGMFLFSDPVSNPKRAGWIALSQIPVSFLLSSKNSIIGFLVGKGYEKLNYIHRWVGQTIFIASLFHVVAYLVMWTKANNLTTKMQSEIAITGMVTFAGISVIALTALPVVRNQFWTIFTYGHVIGFTVLIFGACYHVPAALPWCLIAVSFYLLDLILRVVQSHYVTANIEYLPALKVTRVVVPSLHSGWRAGQHIRLSVLTSGMGLMKAVESHPFTIASTSEDQEGMVLYCREAGDWTRQLAKLARGSPASGLDLGLGAKEAGFGSGRSVNVLVQGPYGGPGNVVFSSFSSAMFICGGGGITFGLSATQDVIRDAFDRCSHIRVVDLVWVVQDPSALLPILPTFKRLIAASESISSVSLHINVHYTRASGISPSFIEELDLPEGIKLVPGRPDLGDMLAALCDCTSGIKHSRAPGGESEKLHGVVVGCCGPEPLMDSVRKVEHGIGRSVRNAVGGVELVEEAFAW
ncbi:hypothetical protein DL93DRAFT_2083848 [Clavulina sp. PMI_390]|nr:hypothetical protein DL93DRAFT_2083848 [Clavulina sp. PMI_390]